MCRFRLIISLFLSMLLSLCEVGAQNVPYDFGFERNPNVPVAVEEHQLSLPWVGGLNSVHISEMDVNLDGIPDLLGFEKHGNRLLPFLRIGNGYVYAPEYARLFPDLHDWVVLRDYNHDGKADIFTYGLASIRVFKNVSESVLRFELVADPLQAYYYNGYTNIYASPDDYLVVDDVDGDGHLDVLNFWVLGRYVHQLRNYAEAGEPFDFRLENECWGHFAEAVDNNRITLFTDCDDRGDGDDHPRHTGSSMLLHDFSGNGLPDLLVGDVDSPYNILLYNHGTLGDAQMTAQDTAFPANMPIHLYSMPAPSLVTLPGRDEPSLVVSPSDPSLTKSQDLNSVWVYDYNAQLQQYTLSQTDFLQGEMIDVGSGAHPVLFDFDGDGLMDLFVSNYGQFDSAKSVNGWLTSYFSSSVCYYRNTGTATAPAFSLQTRDFGNLKPLGLNALHPAFGDFDGDGATDMLCGVQDGTLVLVPHQRLMTGTGQLTMNFANVDVGEYSTPQYFDLDGDGRKDLILGNRRGLLSYYRNTGQDISDFQKVTDTLGGVDTRDFTQSYFGYSVPCFYRDAQLGTVLFCAGELGEVAYYKHVDGNLDGEFECAEPNLVETIHGVAKALQEGRRVAAAVADLNGDGHPELLVGNYAGGVAYFDGAAPPVHTDVAGHETPSLRLYPNPAYDILHLESDQPLGHLDIYDSFGRIVLSISNIEEKNKILHTKTLSPGVYIIRSTNHTTSKFLKANS